MLKEIEITMNMAQIYSGIITLLLAIIGYLFNMTVKSLDKSLQKIEGKIDQQDKKIDNLVSKSELQAEIKLLGKDFQGKIDLIQMEIEQIKIDQEELLSTKKKKK